uniref:Small nuclear RNA activating complex, polypeptide 1b n=1 Tax=Oryzias melastigma TaxID=30732 RepID=A0A3B3BP83_ORYME
MPPFSFQIRVGGLYLLYSLYHSQGGVPLEQIRLALKDWEDVKKFEKDAVDAQHFDVVFILHKLMSSKAILFTAMPITLVFTKKRKVETSALCEDFVERAARPQELVNADLLEELSNIHELYENMKSAVTPQAESSMNLIRKDLASQLRSSVMDFHNWQQTKMCKSRRHRQVEVDVPVSEAESQHASGSSRIIKPSLRSRTTENILISGQYCNGKSRN